MTFAVPFPRSASHAVMRVRASSLGVPFLTSTSTRPYMALPSSVVASFCTSTAAPSAGSITCTMGNPYARANSWSRVSCAGTAMTAPVPYVAIT